MNSAPLRFKMVKFFYPSKQGTILYVVILMSGVSAFITLVEGFYVGILFFFPSALLGTIWLSIYCYIAPEIEVNGQKFRLVLLMSKSNWYHQNQIINVDMMQKFWGRKLAWVRVKEGEGKYKTFLVYRSISNFDDLITYLQHK